MVQVLIDVHEDFYGNSKGFIAEKSYGAVWDRVMFVHTIYEDICFVLEFYPYSDSYRQAFCERSKI